MPYRFHRMVFRDLATLGDYLSGQLPDVRTIRRRLFIAEWRDDRYTPDHVQKNLHEHNLGRRTESHRELVIGSLHVLADRYLIVRAGRPWVKAELFDEWQTMLTWLAPLPVLTARLWSVQGAPGQGLDAVRRHLDEVLAPVFDASVLPTCHDPVVEGFIQREGLHDLHIHLNGTTEIDGVWLDVLLQRRSFLAELLKSGDKE